jgi:hypothetical protein
VLTDLFSSVVYKKVYSSFLSRKLEIYFCEIEVLPARIELATFHLGGERSIQLSYGSKTFKIFDYLEILRIVID